MPKETSEDHSSEFLERRELVRLQTIADNNRHDLKMKELGYMRENERINHEHSLERGRIKSAEIRKADERKAMMYAYPRGPPQ